MEKLTNNLGDIFERSDIWGENIFKDERFQDECAQLNKLNKEENSIIKYYYNIVFEFFNDEVNNPDDNHSIDDDNDDKIDDEDDEIEKYRKKRTKLINND